MDTTNHIYLSEAKTVSRWLNRISVAAVAAFLIATVGGVQAKEVSAGTSYQTAQPKKCPNGWVSSNAPGGCSPGFLTLKLAGVRSTLGCPKGWVSSSAPGGCSPGFFTLNMNGTRDSRNSCPDGWVRSSAPGGCSPEYLTLELTGKKAINSCPSGWVRSSAPGGCSPDNFTLEPGFDGVDHARYHCAFGPVCQPMIDAIVALGGVCTTDGPDTTCNLPPLIED